MIRMSTGGLVMLVTRVTGGGEASAVDTDSLSCGAMSIGSALRNGTSSGCGDGSTAGGITCTASPSPRVFGMLRRLIAAADLS
jgi:hypothetical protein